MLKEWVKWVITVLLWTVVCGVQSAPSKEPLTDSGIATVAKDSLPPQAHSTYRLVFEGGPFPYNKDGSIFGNRERLLPIHPRGYYREYTVKTPGLSHRGARRIVCGGPATRPHTCYYTADHYASFRKIVP